MTTPDSATERPAHLALFVGSHDPRTSEVVYHVSFYCRKLPAKGDTVTTALADVTCSECLERKQAAKDRVAESLGWQLTYNDSDTTRELH